MEKNLNPGSGINIPDPQHWYLMFFLRVQALSRDECRPECEDGKHLDLEGNCVNCPQGTYRRQGQELGCANCPKGFTTSKQGEKI
jgi:hypothetical protein